MANPRRHERPNALMHVIARGVHGDRLFPDDDWMGRFERLFAFEAATRNWAVWSYCLMGTHYHFVVSTPDCSLAEGMQRMHVRYAQGRNQGDRIGRVMGTPYRAIDIRSNAHLASCLRYVPMNPVKAGLCTHPADWRFGSFRAIVGIDACPSWLKRDRVLTFLDRAPGEYSRWVTARSQLDPPLSQREVLAFEIRRHLLAGRTHQEIAELTGASVRWVERIAATGTP